MPLPLTLTPNNRASKIKNLLNNIIENYQFALQQSDEELSQQKISTDILLDQLGVFDLSHTIPNIDRLLYEARTNDKSAKPSKFMFGSKAFQGMVFCEIILFSKNNFNELEDETERFVFLKSQLPEILEILKPAAENHKIIYNLSDLATIKYDIQDTASYTDAVATNFNYCIFELEYGLYRLKYDDMKRPTNVPLPLENGIKYLSLINTPESIQELANPSQSFKNLPITLKRLKAAFPSLPNEVHHTFVSYLHVIGQNLNTDY